ncbi:MAG: methyltransferase domain-containing protein [Alphaproteobacteria bacterium]|nr:methyltransferase domain-containing protein [Alphaproteobacteria bacterium]
MPEPVILKRDYAPERVKKQFAAVAWFYDVWGALTERKALDRMIELASLKDGDHVLEVAVGSGRLLASLAAQYPKSKFCGVDLSPAMLARARKRFAQIAPAAAYELKEGDAYCVPYEDDTFDVLINSYMLDLLPTEDHSRILAEFGRVLKPGGKLLLAYFSHGARKRNRFWPWLARHYPALLTNCRPIRPQAAVTAAGFAIEMQEEVSQNTFPSGVIVARKGGAPV